MILIVEDDRVVAETLTEYLRQAGYAVDAVADGVTGLARARDERVRLVILDLMLPGLGGREVCRQLRATSRVPVLMLTARSSEEDRVAGFDLGADDYVAKPFSPREVVARVQALLRRAGQPQDAPPPALHVGEVEIDRWARQVRVRGHVVPLTATEFRILEALAANPGRAFTREELVARAFGPDFDGMDRTVDVHITNIRRKLLPAQASQVIVTVHGIGYRLASSDAH